MPATDKRGRKFQDKTWNVEFRQHFRTTVQNASDIHLLLFLAGDKSDELIKTALRDFIINNELDITSTENQTTVMIEAGKYLAQHKKSPTADELLKSIGRVELIEKLSKSISDSSLSHKNAIRKTNRQIKPEKVSVFCEESPNTNLQNESSYPESHLKSESEHTIQQVRQIPPTPEDKKAVNKPPLDFGASTDSDSVEPTTNAPTSAKSRWLKGHDSY